MAPKWRKLGLLYQNHGLHPKLKSHSANPLAVQMDDDLYRVFFSARDDNNRSSVGAVDIDIVRRELIAEHSEPFALHGGTESYFHAGISIGNCYEVGGRKFIFFMGWQVPKDGHWFGELGRLELTDDFQLVLADPDEPFFKRDQSDPLSLSYPWVLSHGDGTLQMYYGSTISWDAGNGEMLHVINQGTSSDGVSWQKKGLAVPFHLGKQQAFSKPAVLKNENGWDMWFSFRGTAEKTYRIGHASSVDGVAWTLTEGYRGIEVSATGWDSEMIEYPHVFNHKGKSLMLYNGNDFGKSGFGLAELDC